MMRTIFVVVAVAAAALLTTPAEVHARNWNRVGYRVYSQPYYGGSYSYPQQAGYYYQPVNYGYYQQPYYGGGYYQPYYNNYGRYGYGSGAFFGGRRGGVYLRF